MSPTLVSSDHSWLGLELFNFCLVAAETDIREYLVERFKNAQSFANQDICFHMIIEHEEVIGWLMAATAVLAIIIDLSTAILLWAMSKGSLNVRTAFIHNLVDAFGSVAVLIGAAAVIWFDWLWVDSAIMLMIAAYVLWQVFKMFPEATRVLMEGTPLGLDFNEADSE